MITEARHNLLTEYEEKVEEEQASSSSSMKYRTPERCFIEGCRKYGPLFQKFSKKIKSCAQCEQSCIQCFVSYFKFGNITILPSQLK